MKFENGWASFFYDARLKILPPLQHHAKADVVIVGGGMAGLSAAAALIGNGLKIILLEKLFCGGSSSGKSAGFLTPDSELELWQLINRYGKKKALTLWNSASKGTDLIIENIKRHQISCDMEKQDSLFLGAGKSGAEDVKKELEARKNFGFKQTFYDADKLPHIIIGKGFDSALLYDSTYVFNSFLYCQGLRSALINQGVEIYESSQVTRLQGHTVHTEKASVEAKQVVFCADKLPTHLFPQKKSVYAAQTFLAVSEPLTEQVVKNIFPARKFQCWDSELIYTYFRLTADNRMVIGGGSKLTTFLTGEIKADYVIEKVIARWKQKFPAMNQVEFTSYWNGRIDTTRDLLPYLTQHPKYEWIHYVQGCAGLPWASFCGDLMGRKITGKSTKEDKRLFKYFGNRPWIFPSVIDILLGKKLSFSISSLWAKYHN